MAAEAHQNGSDVLASLKCAFCPGYCGSGLAWTVGGVLVLTTRELWFRSGPAEFRDREERIPVQDIAFAEATPVGVSPHGIKVRVYDDEPLYFVVPVFVGSERVQAIVELINEVAEESAE